MLEKDNFDMETIARFAGIYGPVVMWWFKSGNGWHLLVGTASYDLKREWRSKARASFVSPERRRDYNGTNVWSVPALSCCENGSEEETLGAVAKWARKMLEVESNQVKVTEE